MKEVKKNLAKKNIIYLHKYFLNIQFKKKLKRI